VNTAAQWTTIASMMMCGLAMGIVFDVYRVASHRFHVTRWLLPALDVIYWAAATLGVFNILLGSNQGEVRMYVFLGLGIGVTGYFGLFSGWVVKASGKIIDILKALFHFLWKLVNMVVLTPLLWIVKGLAKLIDIVFIIIAALLLWLGKPLLKPLSMIGRWLWPKLLPIRRASAPIIRVMRSARELWRQVRDVRKRKP
jgi:spore cortex biosynthesis protein YabQ